MTKKGLSQANTLRSNNTSSTGYGIVYADEIIGHRSVKNLTALYALNTWQLSPSGNNENNDAIGQLWYVTNADGSGNGYFYQLKNWENRTSSAGWERFNPGSGSSGSSADLTEYAKIADVESSLANKVDKETGKALSSNDFTNEAKLKVAINYIADINPSQLDTCGYDSVKDLISECNTNPGEHRFHVYDLNCTLRVWGDDKVLYQIIESHYLPNSDGDIDVDTYNDGYLYTCFRAYLNKDAYINENTGYTKDNIGWTSWQVMDSKALSKEGSWAISQAILMYGKPYFIDLYKDSTNKKVQLQIGYIGGTFRDPAEMELIDIPEVSSLCNGLMSIADKAKLDNLNIETVTSAEVDSLWEGA